MYAAEHAAKNPDHPAIVMAPSGDVVTFGDYEATANRVAHMLRDSGLEKRDHMAIFMENHPAVLMTEAGAERSGVLFTPINSYLSAEEAAYIVNDCQARVVVSSASKFDVAQQLPELCPKVERWLVVGSIGGALESYESWEETVAAASKEHLTDEQMGAPMPYSSGTTGRPKGIVRPVPNIHPSQTSFAVMRIVDLWRFREGMVYLSPAPLYHTAPQVSCAIALRMKSTVVVMEHFDPVLYLELVARYRITHSQVVPTVFTRLLKLPASLRDTADVSSLEWVIHAAAPCPIPVKEEMIDWFGPILLEYYTASEGIGGTSITSEDWLTHKGSVGKALGATIHILDDDGSECPVGTPGTVWFSGATNFSYFNDLQKTEAATRDTSDGRMSTVDDIGYLDAEGYLFLTDRKAHVIISGGVNIYPAEIEMLLMTHPAVQDAAVIGVPHEDLGEQVWGVVQTVDGVAGDGMLEQQLIEFCRSQLAHYKCPRSFDFVDELPRLPTGKLYKGVLRSKYWSGRDTKIV